AGLLAALVFAVLAGAVGVGWGDWQAVQARDSEAERRREAEDAREQAEASVYLSRIAQAQPEDQANHSPGAQTLLGLCPPRRRGWEWHYLHGLLHADLLTTAPLHSGPYVFDVAFSSDGRFLASAGGGNPFYSAQGNAVRPGEVLVWDAATGQLVYRLGGHNH